LTSTATTTKTRGDPDLPMVDPVPKGRLPDPETDTGVVCPNCFTGEDRRDAARDHQHTVRVLLGEFD
jgi:hypothetical protein